jgi:uroporphyrinogen decarboxylase
MKPRERVLATLAHEEPDYVPVFFLGFTPQWVERLIGRRPTSFVKDYLPLYNRFDSDIVVVGPDVFYPFDVYATEDRVDEWGRTLRVVGLYCEFVDFPIKRPEDIDTYVPPDPHKPGRMKDIIETRKVIGDSKAIMSVVNGPFEPAWALRGLQNFLKDLHTNPSLVDKCLDIVTKFEIEIGKDIIEAGADIILIGDDYGWQRSLMMSPELWRRFIFPRLRKVVQEFKKYDIPVILHSDGNINAILDDLAMIGLNGLNPIQTTCGVLPQAIKEKYPDLALVGTVDTQYTLPFGSREDVAREVMDTISVAAQGGGLIMGPQHAVQPDVPVENIDTMVRAIRKYGRYPFRNARACGKGCLNSSANNSIHINIHTL